MNEIALHWAQRIKEDIEAFSDGKYFDTIYYDPVKPKWLPWRAWFWILKRYFTSKTMWMEKIKQDKGGTVTFTRCSPLPKQEAQ